MNQYKLGLKYGLIFMLIAASMGFLYGLLSGVILQPMFFAVVIVGVFVSINFSISLVSIIPWIIMRLSRKKAHLLQRYISISLAFFTVFFPIFIFLKLFPINIF
ncbi:hypothetical protein BC781_102771 [Sediminitomix flava]|uniref:Uncharacterized protein n=1 Tax=Sediminitomix flava TaxID=379075 RepID=A0A315ZD52_SEDFL|nr:hypothetical protein BC781_102771 [Sediminitomix flava]